MFLTICEERDWLRVLAMPRRLSQELLPLLIFFRVSENSSLLILDTFSDKHFSDIQVSAKVEAILYLQAIAVLGNASIGFPKDCNFRKAVVTTDRKKISCTLQVSLFVMAHLERNDGTNTR